MLKVSNLKKEFKNVIAVDDISFSVEPGKIFGILGPNGAGKTTTIRVILDIIKPTSGSITFKDRDRNPSFQNKIGYLPEERGIYKKSKVLDVIKYFLELKNLSHTAATKNAKDWLRKMDILRYSNYKVEELSKGNQQKVQFIIAIAHDPEILILDEPFAGFDPINQFLVTKIIKEFLDLGKIIILSTHMMEVAENLCTNIFLINKGREVLSGSLKEIKRSNDARSNFRIDFVGDDELIKNLPEVQDLIKVDHHKEVLLNADVEPGNFLREIVNLVDVTHFSKVEPSLNNIFLEAVRKSNLQVNEKSA